MRLRMHALALMVLFASGCTAPRGGPVDTGPGTLQAARKFLEGRWTLMSFEVFPPGRPGIQLKGDGVLTYDAFSNLNMEIRVSDPKVAEELARAGVPLKDGVVSTTGRTTVDMQSRTLTYFLEGEPQLVSTAPAGPLAMNKARHWEVNGKVLTLTVKGDNGQPVSVGRWQKVD